METFGELVKRVTANKDHAFEVIIESEEIVDVKEVNGLIVAESETMTDRVGVTVRYWQVTPHVIYLTTTVAKAASLVSRLGIASYEDVYNTVHNIPVGQVRVRFYRELD